MDQIQQAVATLQKRGIAVQTLAGPRGFRFQLTLPDGTGYQYSAEEICRLHSEGKLTSSGIKELAEEIRKANEK